MMGRGQELGELWVERELLDGELIGVDGVCVVGEGGLEGGRFKAASFGGGDRNVPCVHPLLCRFILPQSSPQQIPNFRSADHLLEWSSCRPPVPAMR